MADCWKNLQIENRTSSCQRWSLHRFQASHFICNRFGWNVGCNRIRITPDIVSKLLCEAIWSRCAVLFESEQTPFPRTGRRCCFAQNSMWNMLFCSYVIILLRDQWLIERLSQAMGAALVGDTSRQFHPSRKFNFSWKKMWLVAARYLQSIKTFLTLELSQYRKSGSMSSSSEPVAARSDFRRLRPSESVWPAQALPESGPKSLAVDLAV